MSYSRHELQVTRLQDCCIGWTVPAKKQQVTRVGR
jgi:hypothetical protein